MQPDAEMQHLAADLDVEVYPGTEIMHDYIGTHLTHSHNEKSGTVLVPQPSEDLDDPLNWNIWWKWTVIVIQAFFMVASVVSALSVSPLTPVFMAQFNRSASDIAMLTGALVLTTGYTNLVLVPIADVYGRRFVLIICSFVCLGGTVWQGAAQSYGSFMGARVLVAVGMSIGETLMPMVISDMFFLHERGRYMAIYFFFLFNSMFAGPLIAGEADAHFGTWRTFYWIFTGLEVAACILILLLHPETLYHRKVPAAATATAASSTSDAKRDEAEQVDELSTSAPNNTTATSATEAEGDIVTDRALGNGRPTRAQFRLIQPGQQDAMFAIYRHVITPVKLLAFPIVLFGAWMLASTASGLLAVNYIQSAALTAPPYNFSNGAVGMTNLALVVGGTIGMFTAGPLSDWTAMILTKRNRGIREPEMRLWSMIPFVILSGVALVIIGVGFDNQWSWQVVVCLGFGGVGLMTVSVSSIGITYAVDSYKPVAGQIMIIATVIKNSLGFGMGYYILEWVGEAGYTPLFMSELGMVVGPALIGVVFFHFYGKRMRKITCHSEVHGF